MTDGELVTVTEARRRAGLSTRAVKDAIKAGNITAYRTGKDRRLTLVRLDDARSLAEPRPIQSTAGK